MLTAAQLISAATDIKYRHADPAPKQTLTPLLSNGKWWSYCLNELTDLDALLDADPTMHQVLGLFASLESSLLHRALAVAHAAHARRTGDSSARAEAARLWNNAPAEPNSPADLSDLVEEFPHWSWTAVSTLIDSDPHDGESRLIVPLLDRGPGNLVVSLAPNNGPAGFWPHPLAMTFAKVPPRVREQFDLAWQWAANQDRFKPGHSAFWTLLNSEGRPVRTVPEQPLGAAAAVALTYALHLAPGTKRGPSGDKVVIADLHPSGALTPVPSGPIPASFTGHVIVADNSDRTAIDTRIHRAATVGEAAALFRRRRRWPTVVAAAAVVGLVVGMTAVIGNIRQDAATRADRENLAEDYAVRAAQNPRPDEAILLALAASSLNPDDARVRSTVVKVLNRDIRLSEVLTTDHGQATAVALGNTVAATGAADGTTALHDPILHTTATLDDVLPGPVTTLAFSPDSRLLAAGGSGSVIVRDMRTGRVIWRARHPVSTASFAHDNKGLVIGGADGSVLVHYFDGRPDRLVTGAPGRVRAAALLPNELVAFGGDGSTVEVFDTSVEPPARRAAIPTKLAVTSLVQDESGERFAFTNYTGTVTTYSTDTLTQDGQETRTVSNGRLISSPGAQRLLLGSANSALSTSLQDLTSGKLSSSENFPQGGQDPGLVAISPDGNRVATPSASGTIIVWSNASRPDLRRLRVITAAHPVAGADLIVVASGGSALQQNSALVLLDRSTGELVHVVDLETPLDALLRPALEFDPMTSTLVARTRDGTAHVYRVVDRKLVKVMDFVVDLPASKQAVTAARFDTAHHRLLLARGEDLVAVELDQLQHPVERAVHHSAGTITHILPVNGELALAGRAGLEVLPIDGQGRVTGDGRRLSRRLPMQATVSADGVLATGSAEGVVEVHRRRAGDWTTIVVPGHEGPVTGLALYGDYLVSGGRDTNVRVYDLGEDAPVTDDDLSSNLFPTSLWNDRHGVVVSSDFSYTSVELVLDPAEAVQKACALGGWAHSHPRIRDIDPSAPESVAELRLCEA